MDTALKQAKEAALEHPNADIKTVERIAKQVHPFLRTAVMCIYIEICDKVASKYVRVRFSDILRSIEEQNELYKQGRSKPGRKVTWVRGGGSYHQYGLAIDIVLLLDKDKNGSFESASWDTTYDGDEDGMSDWKEVADIFKENGWQWGLMDSSGKRYDLPHFQRDFGYKAMEFLSMKKDSEGFPIIP